VVSSTRLRINPFYGVLRADTLTDPSLRHRCVTSASSLRRRCAVAATPLRYPCGEIHGAAALCPSLPGNSLKLRISVVDRHEIDKPCASLTENEIKATKKDDQLVIL
jgi:hypothetical protein